jgi:hypothetical protein
MSAARRDCRYRIRSRRRTRRSGRRRSADGPRRARRMDEEGPFGPKTPAPKRMLQARGRSGDLAKTAWRARPTVRVIVRYPGRVTRDQRLEPGSEGSRSVDQTRLSSVDSFRVSTGRAASRLVRRPSEGKEREHNKNPPRAGPGRLRRRTRSAALAASPEAHHYTVVIFIQLACFRCQRGKESIDGIRRLGSFVIASMAPGFAGNGLPVGVAISRAWEPLTGVRRHPTASRRPSLVENRTGECAAACRGEGEAVDCARSGADQRVSPIGGQNP